MLVKSSKGPWIACDLDKTLATYPPKHGQVIGDPIPNVVQRMKKYLREGKTVKIFTARVGPPRTQTEISTFTYALDTWCNKVFGQTLPVTCTKDHFVEEIWDDRAVQVVPNTGEILEDTVEMLKRQLKAKQ